MRARGVACCGWSGSNGVAVERLGPSFARAVELIKGSSGRVIVSGIGKSGLIGRKIAATMTSTGTPAYFLHPTESVHGDLGVVTDKDIAILLSKSGETVELLPLLEQLTRLGGALHRDHRRRGLRRSRAPARLSQPLDGWVREEACPARPRPHDEHDAGPRPRRRARGGVAGGEGVPPGGLRAVPPGRVAGAEAAARRRRDVIVSKTLPILPGTATKMREAVVQLAERRGICVIAAPDEPVARVIATETSRASWSRNRRSSPSPSNAS